MKTIKTKYLSALVLGCFFGCSPARGTASSDPTTSHTPNLCTIDGGRWCMKCGHAGEVACPPAEDSGWLCCKNGVCIAVALSGDCTNGTVGWCDNYTVKRVGDSLVAQCHDGS